MPTGSVNCCVCRGVGFADLLRLHRETGAGFEDLKRLTGCGTGCGMCEPYIRAAIATGRTSLPVLSPQQLRLMAGAWA